MPNIRAVNACPYSWRTTHAKTARIRITQSTPPLMMPQAGKIKKDGCRNKSIPAYRPSFQPLPFISNILSRWRTIFMVFAVEGEDVQQILYPRAALALRYSPFQDSGSGNGKIFHHNLYLRPYLGFGHYFVT